MSVAAELSILSPQMSGAPADRALANLRANLRAIGLTQPAIASRCHDLPSNVDWVLARDGSLTAILDGNRWWAGCSVPLAAARFMLNTMQVQGNVGCFLNPLHAAQLRVALDLLSGRQALVAIVPDGHTLAVLLHADDFSNEIAAGRLWFAAGSDWESELRAIFHDHPGLPTPVEFVRPITANSEPTDALIDPAQRVFAQVSSTRATQLQDLGRAWRADPEGVRRVCLLAPSEFRLWDDAALVLADMDFGGEALEIHRIDSDRPTSSSPLALTLAACRCDAVLAANVFRKHLPGVIPDSMPWITWATTSAIPPAKEAGPNDRLLLADESALTKARQLGWADAHIELAPWPALPLSDPSRRQLAVVADTCSLEVPAEIEAYSSQVLLWESIRDELGRDPFLAVGNPQGYLNARRSRFQIGDDGFEQSIFIRRLIAPAVQQGIARRLIKDGMPVGVFGRGWDQVDVPKSVYGGAITSRQQLAEVVSQPVALVNVWPWEPAHAIEATGRPVVGTRRLHDFLSDARRALNGTLDAPPISGTAISPGLIARAARLSSQSAAGATNATSFARSAR